MNNKFTIDEKIKLKTDTKNFKDGDKIIGNLKLLDRNEVLLGQKDFNVKVKDSLAIYPFVIKDILKELNVNSRDVSYVKGWMDSDGNGKYDRLYDLEVILEVVNCYCNRDFTVDEVKNIVKELRDSEEETKGKYGLFTASNCKLPQSDKTYERFTEELNKTFKKYEINTCLRKIHFLAQAYQETKFITNIEAGKENYLKSLSYYPYYGRGLLQITWDYNSAKYYDYNHNTKYFKNYITYLDENKLKPNNTRLNDCIDKKLKNGTVCLSQSDYNNIQNKYKNISEYLENTVDVSGWFWRYGSAWGDLNNSADKDDIYYINIGINGGFNHFANRIKYAKQLIKFFKSYECINIKLSKVLGKYSLINSSMINTKFIKISNNKSQMEAFDDK